MSPGLTVLGKTWGPPWHWQVASRGGFCPQVFILGQGWSVDTGTAQPGCSSVGFQISYLCVLSAAVYGPWDDKLPMCVPCLILAFCWEKEKGLCDDNLACE